jgi:hypothetical protein
VYIDLPIEKRMLEVFEIVLIGQRVAIVLEASLNFSAFFLCHELGSVIY